MPSNDMTVEQLFTEEKIDKDFISDNFDSDYWFKCDMFVRQNWTTDIESLTDKQAAWLTKILDSCVEKRIEKR